MSQHSFHVMIIGGGLGGLCLAQGLKKAGISVAIYERDRTRNERLQGYRIHIEAMGNRALHDCLPSHLFEAYLKATGSAGSGLLMCDEQLNHLMAFPVDVAKQDDPLESSRSVSRITLRQVLLAELDEIVQFDKCYSHYQENPDGSVTAFFEDGTSATGDLLVAADGGAVHDLSGKASERTQGTIGANEEALLEEASALFENTNDYYFWAFLTRQKNYPVQRDLQQLPGGELLQMAQDMIEGWHPTLRHLVSLTEPSTVIATPLRIATSVAPWESQNITLLGDAIHSMPPTRGIGGNTALKDAQLLCQKLIAVARQEQTQASALKEYVTVMLHYSFAAVKSSKQSLDMMVMENSVGRALTKTALRSVNLFTSRKKSA